MGSSGEVFGKHPEKTAASKGFAEWERGLTCVPKRVCRGEKCISGEGHGELANSCFLFFLSSLRRCFSARFPLQLGLVHVAPPPT